MYGLELLIIVFSTLAQALTGAGPAANIVGLMIFWRVIMVSCIRPGTLRSRLSAFANTDLSDEQGVGIGGDYPLSSVIAAE